MTLFSYYKQREVLARNIEESEHRLKDIRRMKKEGIVTRNDEIRSELQLTNDRLAYQEADNSISIASQQLDILLGLDESQLIAPDTTLLYTAVSVSDYDTYVQLAYNNYPGMQIVRQQTLLAENDIRLTKANYLPSLSLHAGNTLARPLSTTLADMYNNNWNIGLSLSYNLSSLYQNKHKMHEARQAVQLQKYAEELLMQNIRIQIRTACTRHKEALNRIEALKLSVSQAEENYRIVQNRYLNQLSILTDLLDASSVRLDAELQLKRLRIRNITLNTVCILLALAGISWTINYFWKYVHYEITNDAVVDQYIAPLNIRASGYIKEVRFTEHQPVHAGDTLLILDNREYLIKVKDAEAALMDAKGAKDVLSSGIQTSQVNVAIQEANIAETKAKLWQQEQDYRRYANLLAEESVSQQQYEQVKTAYEATQARYQALLQQKEAAKSQYSETSKKSTGIEANILRKEADLDMAKLNLSYTIVTAPYNGYIGRRTLEPGQFVQAGQTISHLVRGNDKWITANYKETQISHIYIGQKVRIKVDAFRGHIFHGTVTAISEATDSKYALVPTDNSAGNFVKVQQRIPVRIELDDATPEEMKSLRAGMMVETEALKRG